MAFFTLVYLKCRYIFTLGGEPGSTGQSKCKWRVVVGQWATLKADYIFICRE